VRDRFRGALLGVAVGDCLGRPVEGHRQVPESYLVEAVQDPPKLFYTDDTAMTFSVGDSLLACDGFDGGDLAQRFADEYRREPHRGYGAGVITVFDRVDRGIPWADAAARQFGGTGSYGNGAAMRVAPAALFGHPDIDRAVALAADTAQVTHTHPVGIDGAIAQAVSVHLALSDSDEHGFVDELARRIRTDEFRMGLENLVRALARADDEWAVLQLGHGVAADRSVLTALYCFLRSDSFQQTVLRGLAAGGDTDTITSMAAALAGARYGESAIPPKWRAVEGAMPLRNLADQLYARLPS
jgi:poly(ADP-ribose) glycohydrolase ARH3